MSDENNDIKKACVMGWPIGHSLSPRLHSYWLEKYGIAGSYTSMAVMPEQLKDALMLLKDRGFVGCNLTMPLKQMALSLMDDHDESCLMSGAANTVVIEDGKFKGYNSDGWGFLESLNSQMPDWDGAHVVVLGTGGASRGIIATLRGAGAKKFTLVNRTPAHAERLVKAFTLQNAEVRAWEDRDKALRDATLLINCTSLGMVDSPPLEISLDALPLTAGVADIVYQPLMTPLLAAAQNRGNKTAEGLPMLLHQGRLGFDYWFGRDPEVTRDLYDIMAEASMK